MEKYAEVSLLMIKIKRLSKQWHQRSNSKSNYFTTLWKNPFTYKQMHYKVFNNSLKKSNNRLFVKDVDSQ